MTGPPPPPVASLKIVEFETTLPLTFQEAALEVRLQAV